MLLKLFSSLEPSYLLPLLSTLRPSSFDETSTSFFPARYTRFVASSRVAFICRHARWVYSLSTLLVCLGLETGVVSLWLLRATPEDAELTLGSVWAGFASARGDVLTKCDGVL